VLTRQRARVRARQICAKLAAAGGKEASVELAVAALTDELIALDAEARTDRARSIATGPAHDLTLVMIGTAGWEGWANLVLDGERRHIAVLPPPFVEILKAYIPLRRWPRSP
jgi:hypothetical protein